MNEEGTHYSYVLVGKHMSAALVTGHKITEKFAIPAYGERTKTNATTDLLAIEPGEAAAALNGALCAKCLVPNVTVADIKEP